MAYEVHIDRAAQRKIRRLDRPAQKRVSKAIDDLADDPRPTGTKALTGPFAGHYRLRISAPGGEYRIVWQIDDKAKRVDVIDAGSRENTY